MLPSIDGCRPLQTVLQQGHRNAYEIIQLLIRHGANVNAADSEKHSPLHSAVFSESRDEKEGSRISRLIDILVEEGANLEARDAYQQTPLYIAVLLNSPNAFSALRNHYANFGARNHYRSNLLHGAAVFCNTAMLELLQSSRTLIELNPYLKNNDDDTPWDSFIR